MVTMQNADMVPVSRCFSQYGTMKEKKRLPIIYTVIKKAWMWIRLSKENVQSETNQSIYLSSIYLSIYLLYKKKIKGKRRKRRMKKNREKISILFLWKSKEKRF